MAEDTDRESPVSQLLEMIEVGQLEARFGEAPVYHSDELGAPYVTWSGYAPMPGYCEMVDDFTPQESMVAKKALTPVDIMLGKTGAFGEQKLSRYAMQREAINYLRHELDNFEHLGTMAVINYPEPYGPHLMRYGVTPVGPAWDETPLNREETF